MTFWEAVAWHCGINVFCFLLGFIIGHAFGSKR